MRHPVRINAALSLAFLAAGCASKPAIPEISLDAEDFEPAALEHYPADPVRIVRVPEPLPLPGQLKPVQERKARPAQSDEPGERVTNANAAARIEPNRDDYINAIQIYPYTKGALYRLYTAPGQVTDIALQPGEQIVSVSAGDTLRWVVGDTKSGSGVEQQSHILIKPTEPDLRTNLIITTDRRAYHLEMESFEETYMASVSWRYPHDELTSLVRRNAEAKSIAQQTVASGIDLENLRFRYRITGDSPPWRPKRAFDDGRKVYIEFPRAIAQGEAPPLFIVSADGGNELVNYRMRGRYYIVDRLFAAADLRLGEDPQQVVRIVRTDGRNATLVTGDRADD